MKQNILYLAWMQAFVAMITSLYFSEIQQLVPCLLCWYQRIFMYPLVIILAVGIVRRDKSIPYYVLPLSIIGMLLASYHYLLQRGIIPEQVAPCKVGVSCTDIDVQWFGFVTIPLLSLIAFAVITIAMIVFLRSKQKL